MCNVNVLLYLCLILGREFFVGLSERTNHAGAVALAKAFPEYPCSPIKVRSVVQQKKQVVPLNVLMIFSKVRVYFQIYIGIL